VFPILPRSAEAQVIGGGIVQRLLIAYLVGNISAKNINIRSRVYSKSNAGRFLRHGVELRPFTSASGLCNVSVHLYRASSQYIHNALLLTFTRATYS